MPIDVSQVGVTLLSLLFNIFLSFHLSGFFLYIDVLLKKQKAYKI